MHQPVLVETVVRELALQKGSTVLDATIGLGGHAQAILEAIGPTGHLVALDRDRQALTQARENLGKYEAQMKLIHGHFGEIAIRLQELGINSLDAALFDFGVSSYQLDTAERGFSFAREGPLDMRMDVAQELTAADIINRASYKELIHIVREYGEEPWAGRIAGAIVRSRPFSTTTELAQVIRAAVPGRARHGRIDAATRSFQAVRIAVNQELELIESGLTQAMELLRSGGRIITLAYHSLEDRIVKMVFKEQARQKRYRLVVKKPIRPSVEEIARNPRSRSARLRGAERL